jgi:lysine-specific demethylase/histidyl-hydroxylase NO66
VYAPLEGHARPRAHSADLPRSALAAPVLEVTLRPGDVLYLPRGTPHEAVACGAAKKSAPGGGGEPSAHVTLSTYQRWDVGDLASHALGFLLDGAPPGGDVASAAASLRAPLPPGAPFAHPGAAAPPLAAAVAAALRAAAAAIEAHPAAVLGGALDALSDDFMAARLPPAPGGALPRGPLPGPRDAVAAAAPGCCRVAAPPHGRTVALLSCLANARERHMMGADSEGSDGSGSEEDAEEEEEEEDPEREEGDVSDGSDSGSESGSGSDSDDGALVFPADHGEALRAVLAAAAPRGIAVADIPLPGLPAARLAFARGLWAAGIARTLPAAAEQAPPREQGAGKKKKSSGGGDAAAAAEEPPRKRPAGRK